MQTSRGAVLVLTTLALYLSLRRVNSDSDDGTTSGSGGSGGSGKIVPPDYDLDDIYSTTTTTTTDEKDAITTTESSENKRCMNNGSNTSSSGSGGIESNPDLYDEADCNTTPASGDDDSATTDYQGWCVESLIIIAIPLFRLKLT